MAITFSMWQILWACIALHVGFAFAIHYKTVREIKEPTDGETALLLVLLLHRLIFALPVFILGNIVCLVLHLLCPIFLLRRAPKGWMPFRAVTKKEFENEDKEGKRDIGALIGGIWLGSLMLSAVLFLIGFGIYTWAFK